MPVLDILDIIPQSLKQQVLDTLVDFVSGEAKKYVSGEIANKIRSLRSDAAFQRTFEKGLQQAVKRFIAEYEAQDEDLVAALQADQTFFANEQVQKAMLTMLRKPGTYLIEEREKLVQSFDAVLPERKNRERVDKAVTCFLRCLAEELWHLPELLPVYSLQFQRLSAEAAQQQVALQKAQLQALTGLGEGVRTALLQLTDAIGEQKALPSGGRFALPERPKVYHNLPQPDYGRFIGREAELAQVEKILRPYPHSQHALVTIDGIGGIGKSALALEIGHRFLRQFDDLPAEERFEAIIWASAKQTILTAEGISTRRQILRTLDDIYNALAVGLQREDITRARKEDQDEVARNALTRQRTLLIVDNLETVDDEAVLNFLRELPAPAKAIVTTRHRLDVAYPVRLTGMPWDDAKQLIEQECEKKGLEFPLLGGARGGSPLLGGARGGLDQDNAHRLFERTGGVPLAMVWSIAQMGFGYSVEAVLTRLGQPSGDIARFCFEGAVEQITNRPAHKLLMVLSLCADSASRESLGYATELPELDRDDGLVQLEKLSIVNKLGDRFSLLPLTKQYAAAESEKATKKERLREKWIEYFKKLSEEYSGEYWKWANYDWLWAEGENILSIIDLAIATGLEDIALSFTRPAKHYLEMKTLGKLYAEYGQKFYTIAQSANDKRTWAWICIYWLTLLYYVIQGKNEEAENICKRGLALYQELNDIKGMCFANIWLSKILRNSGRKGEAVKIYQQTMDLAKQINYGDGVASVHFEWELFATQEGKWEEAKMHAEAFIKWFEEHQQITDLDIAAFMRMIGDLGWIEFHLGNVRHGKELIERSLAFFERLGGNVPTYRQMAVIEKTLNNREKAIKYAQKAYFYSERWGISEELESARALLAELEQVQAAAGAGELQE